MKNARTMMGSHTNEEACALEVGRSTKERSRSITLPLHRGPGDPTPLPCPIPPSGHPGHRGLIAAVRLWEDQQRHRIRIGNLVGAVERAGAAIPKALTDSFDRVKESEDAIGKLVVTEWRKHPLAPWCKTVRGLGEHSAAILVAMLDGDPYVAHPKRWEVGRGQSRSETHRLFADPTSAPRQCCAPHGTFDGPDEVASQGVPEAQHFGARHLVFDPPFERSVSQLWQYCGIGKPGRRSSGMSQEDAFALGKPLLKSRLRLIAEGMLKASNPHFRAIYDITRAHVAERVHEKPCAQCRAKAGDPWRKGHQHAHALRIVAKRFLQDLWCEAKRLHDAAMRGTDPMLPAPHPNDDDGHESPDTPGRDDVASSPPA